MLGPQTAEKHMRDSENVIKGFPSPRKMQIIISQPAVQISGVYITFKRNDWKCHPHLWRAAHLHWLDVEPTTQLRGARTESSASARVGIVVGIMFVNVDVRIRGRQPAAHAEIFQNW